MKLPSDHDDRQVTRREFLVGAARGAAALTLGATGFHVLSGCSRPPRDTAPRHVIMVSVDTLRADHLGCYGYRRKDISPNIDRLAREGVLFKHAIAQASWTKTSFASMMTGLYPRNHGAVNRDAPLGRVPTLAQRLAAHGFTTVGVVANGWCDHIWGFNKGFQVYCETYTNGRTYTTKADYVNEQLWKTLDKLPRKKDDRLFVWVLYIDPHDPYDPPGSWSVKYKDKGRPAGYPGIPKPSPDDIGPVSILEDENGKKVATSLMVPIYAGINLYDGCIAWTDDNVGKLLDGLDRRDLLDDSLIVFNSDHGEEFLEHNGIAHGGALYQEHVHVPLIFRYPSTRVPKGGLVNGTVRVIDIAPTILELVGAPPLAANGTSLARAIRQHRVQPRVAFADEVLDRAPGWGDVDIQAVWRDNHKLIHIVKQQGGPRHVDVRNKYHLFDLERDPFERNDLIGNLDHAAVETDLRSRLKAFTAHSPRATAPAPARELPTAVRKNLEGLGYLNKTDASSPRGDRGAK